MKECVGARPGGRRRTYGETTLWLSLCEGWFVGPQGRGKKEGVWVETWHANEESGGLNREEVEEVAWGDERVVHCAICRYM